MVAVSISFAVALRCVELNMAGLGEEYDEDVVLNNSVFVACWEPLLHQQPTALSAKPKPQVQLNRALYH